MKQLRPKTDGQKDYFRAIQENKVVFALGPAGTGKTAIATRFGISQLLDGKYEKLVISRPLVQAGEDTGFLPGGIEDKLGPYVRPIYDEIEPYLPKTQLNNFIAERIIEIVPFAYMRGRNFHGAFIVADECQNATRQQLRMLLTRIGHNSKMVVNGDIQQSDLPKHMRGGLEEYASRLSQVTDVATIYLTKADVVREQIVSDILAVIGEDE